MHRIILMIGVIGSITGCANDDTAKTSHFEHDHEIAANWPHDLADAAVKIRERLQPHDHDHEPPHQHTHRHGDGEPDEHDHGHHHHVHHHHGDHGEHDHDHGDPPREPGDEIAEIVSWVPEIAADTNLSEQDWIPLDNAAASLSANLHAADNELTNSNRKQLIAFCELIEQSLEKIPEQLASPKVSSQ